MQYKTLSNSEKYPARLNQAAELRSQFDTEAMRLVPEDVPQPNPPDEPWSVRKQAKAMAASGPGSEYWLP